MGELTKETILKQRNSQRDAFFTRIGERMKDDESIVIVVADMSTPVFDDIRRRHAERFFNVGIAEQNAVLVASGLAKEGKKAFVYAIASFMVLRAFEQIRVEGSIMGLPVTIVGVGAGFSYHDSGPTHHLFEDIAVMRTLPGMTIHSVTDNAMAVRVADASIAMTNPNYVRLERHVEPNIYAEDADLADGFTRLRTGKDGTIVSTGIMVRESLAVAGEMEKRGVFLGVIDVHRFPADEAKLAAVLQEGGRLVSIEETFLPGGLGSYLLEVLSDAGHGVPVKRLGLGHGWCYRYGGREDNRAHHGLDRQSLINTLGAHFKA